MKITCHEKRQPTASLMEGNQVTTNLGDGLADGHVLGLLLSAALQLAREQIEHHVLDLDEARVHLVVRIDKVLDLRHLELTARIKQRKRGEQ